ncbi:hypothetical protein Cni_G00151 [Canna indica]|uniref:Protein kinase domain-containing protein n=1 Tax=Canna indica TaxID=4628 RepID=A0AAQ3JLZ1_9LILI|nr:hypothetical protein Cni_G00151 [Canna indica]
MPLYRDLRGNNLNGPIPSSILSKSGQRLLLRIEGNQNLCGNGNSCEAPRKRKITTPVIVVICVVPLVLLLVTILILYIIRRSKGSTDISAGPEKVNLSNIGHQDNPLQLENRQLTYMKLDKITNNFERVLGHGGFGTVYHGYLEDGTQVAVKMLSQSSSQGTKEFLAEVQHLLRIHHKNLVSMVGYCMESEFMALVYVYMSQGTLQDHFRGKTESTCPLSWGQRLQITIEAAEGLEYLHKACKPPLIHRDVKTANILLTEKLEAKIADFGLSKAFQNDVHSHTFTTVVGTLGYLDPQYHSTYQISEKSDVYSFGVVLLELITVEPPVITGQENAHIVGWVRQKLAKGNIEDVVDSKMQTMYDVNSFWKVVDIAFKCTAHSSNNRPTMTDVMNQQLTCSKNVWQRAGDGMSS